MRRIRFTIGRLLVLVVGLAVAFAALRGATEIWDSGVFTATLGLLTASVLWAIHRSDRKRAFWLGFALFGWSYLIASLLPPVGPRLLTTKALAYLDSKVPRTTPMGVAFADSDSDGQMDLFVANDSAPNALYRNQGDGTFRVVTPVQAANLSTSSGGVIVWNSSSSWKLLAGSGGTTESFVRTGHSILTLVVAVLGGVLSRSLRDSFHEPEIVAAS
jgi:hypothetical protein